MIRAPLGDLEYWNKWVEYGDTRIREMQERVKEPAGDLSYRPQYLFNFAKEHWHQMLCRYSRGDSVEGLARYFPGLLSAWEESNSEDSHCRSPEELKEHRLWSNNLDHYIVCFWLVGLALSLEIPEDNWQRLVRLIDNEGEDALLDRVIAVRQPGRKIGDKLCYPKPYMRLLNAINASPEQQVELLASFVAAWYKELNHAHGKSLSNDRTRYQRPYWYAYGDQNFSGGAYFGRWCIEAVAVVKAFGLDDRLCLGHEHYPGDLLHPLTFGTVHSSGVDEKPSSANTQGRTTVGKEGFFSRFFRK